MIRSVHADWPFALAFTLLLSLPTGVAAQVDESHPDSVAQAYLDAIDAKNWDGAARLLHPDMREDYKSELALMFRCYAVGDSVTVDEFLRAHPDVPRDRAQARVDQLNEWLPGGRRAKGLEAWFPGVATIEAFEAMPAEDVMARVLQREDERRPRGPGADWQKDPRVIGHVKEGRWANVLYRYGYEFEEGDPDRTASFFRHLPHFVVMLRRDGDSWGVGSLMGIGRLGYYGPGLIESMRENAFCPEVLEPFAADSGAS